MQLQTGSKTPNQRLLKNLPKQVACERDSNGKNLLPNFLLANLSAITATQIPPHTQNK